MEEKTGLGTKLAESIRRKARKIGAVFAKALDESEKATQERGHLATRTDHAFMGCNPCPPGDPIPPAESATNITAIPRPKTPDS